MCYRSDAWSKEGIEEFDRLTHVAQWKVREAEVVDYKIVGANRIPIINLFHCTSEKVNERKLITFQIVTKSLFFHIGK